MDLPVLVLLPTICYVVGYFCSFPLPFSYCIIWQASVLYTYLRGNVHSHNGVAFFPRYSKKQDFVDFRKKKLSRSQECGGLYIGDVRSAIGKFIAQAENFKQDARVFKDHWTQIVGDNGVEFYQNVNNKNNYTIMTDVDGTSKNTFDILQNIYGTPIWSSVIQEYEIIKQLDESTIIVYIKLKTMWPIVPRYSVLVSHTKSLENDRYVIISKSIKYDVNKDTLSSIRMNIKQINQYITPTSENRCRIITNLEIDPCGNLPHKLTRYLTCRLVPSIIKQITVYISKAESVCKVSKSDITSLVPRKQISKDAPSTGVNRTNNDTDRIKRDMNTIMKINQSHLHITPFHLVVASTNRLIKFVSPYLITGFIILPFLRRVLFVKSRR